MRLHAFLASNFVWYVGQNEYVSMACPSKIHTHLSRQTLVHINKHTNKQTNNISFQLLHGKIKNDGKEIRR